MAGSVTLQELYNAYDALNESKDKTQHLLEYMKILSGVRGDAKAKALSAQMIPKFYKHFPDLYDTAMDALIDLCEEEDPAVCMLFSLLSLSLLYLFSSVFLSRPIGFVSGRTRNCNGTGGARA